MSAIRRVPPVRPSREHAILFSSDTSDGIPRRLAPARPPQAAPLLPFDGEFGDIVALETNGPSVQPTAGMLPVPLSGACDRSR